MGVLSGTTQAAPEEFTLENRTELVHHHVSGAGAANSFLDRGAHLLHESQLFHRTRLGSGWQSQLGLIVRYTDSPQFSPEKFSLQQFEWRLSDQKNDLVVGDYFANLSSYAMSKSLKGLGYQRNFSNDQHYLRAVVGSFDGQWGFLLRPGHLKDEPMDRHGAGLRYQAQQGALTWGVNLALATDRRADPRRRVGESAWKQTLPSLDWEYRLDALTVAGEHAWADTTEETAAGARNSRNGLANKLSVRAMVGAINLDGRWERVDPDFLSLAGAASPDRQRTSLRADAQIARLWKVFGLVDYSHNNLDGQLPFRTSNTSYEAGVTKRRAFDRRTLTLSGSLRQRSTDLHGGGANSSTDRVKLRATDSVGEVDLRGDVEFIIDDRSGSPSSRDTLYNLGASTRREAGRWTFSPGLDIGLQERENPTGGLDVVHTARLGLLAEHAPGQLFSLTYDHNDSSTPTAGSNTRVGRWVASWETRPTWLKRGALRLELATNEYRFGNAAGNYRERLGRIVATWPLDVLALKVNP
jgi:hypothetical protein